MALPSTLQWDVRTGGSDSNGGGFDPSVTSPGTDFSQQNSAQIAYTDLVIGTTTTQLTSAAHPFTSAHVGNTINITSGTGFTVGRYNVRSVSGSTATMDRAVGTASSTGGNGNLGGSMATPGAALAAIVSGNVVWLQNGTYTITTTIAQTTSANFYLVGYNSTHNDNGSPPTITTATNSVALITISAGATFAEIRNLILTSTASTKAAAVTNSSTSGVTINLENCQIANVTSALAALGGISGQTATVTSLLNCYVSGCTSFAVVAGGTVIIEDSYITGSAANQIELTSAAATSAFIRRSVIVGATGTANRGIFMNSSVGSLTVTESTIAGNAGDGIGVGTNYLAVRIQSCIVYGNGGWGVNVGAARAFACYAAANALGGNTSGSYSNMAAGAGDQALSTGPFTSSGTGDYTLNGAAGGGAACKGAGYPGVFTGGLTTGFLDIGAAQSSGGSSGGGGGSYAFVA